MGTRLHEMEEGAGHKAFLAGGRSRATSSAHHRNASPSSIITRPSALEMGTDTGKTFQDWDQRGWRYNNTSNSGRSFSTRPRTYSSPSSRHEPVVQGDMTLGMMMSVTYIVGQLSSPIEQLIDFSRSLQDAKISLERLQRIHGKEDEERAGGMN